MSLVTAHGRSARAKYLVVAERATDVLVDYLAAGAIPHHLAVAAIANLGFSEPVARDAVYNVMIRRLAVVREDGAIALASAPASQPQHRDFVDLDRHPEAVAAAVAWDRDSRPKGYWKRVIAAVAPAFEAESQRGLEELRARVAAYEAGDL